jgi:hypothetical protein
MARLIELRLDPAGDASGPRPKEAPDGQQPPSRTRRIGTA